MKITLVQRADLHRDLDGLIDLWATRPDTRIRLEVAPLRGADMGQIHIESSIVYLPKPEHVEHVHAYVPIGDRPPGSVGIVVRNGLLCSVCGESQFDTSSGPVCINGHGGAPGVER